MSYRIGIDIGGTFTDMVFLAADGALVVTEVPTTPDDFTYARQQRQVSPIQPHSGRRARPDAYQVPLVRGGRKHTRPPSRRLVSPLATCFAQAGFR